MQPTLSIIMPVYKAEKTLLSAVDCVLKQTFSDFELILIDDASPDRCGVMCDELAERDHRIRVIHKENGGPSSARNAGLEAALGEYIGFMDSDDQILPQMYETLIHNARETDADISHCGVEYVFSNHSMFVNATGIKQLYNHQEGLRELLHAKQYELAVWTKLFRREILNELRFVEHISLSEDLLFTYYAFSRAKKTVFEDLPFYRYIKRDNSLTTSAFQHRKMGGIDVTQKIFDEVCINQPELRDYAARLLILYGINLFNQLNRSGKKNHIQDYKTIITLLRAYFSDVFSNKILERKIRLSLWLLRIHPMLYKIAYRLYKKPGQITRF